MPIYEYRCDACAETFEVLASFDERDRAHACPACESLKTRVMISVFATSGSAEEAFSGGGGGGCACGGRCSCSSAN